MKQPITTSFSITIIFAEADLLAVMLFAMKKAIRHASWRRQLSSTVLQL
jgi:hypothetical protein